MAGFGEGVDNNPALLKILLETQNQLKQVEFYFRGGELDDKKNITYNPELQLLNEKGVNRLFAYLRPRVSKLFTITRFQESLIRDMIYRFRKDLNVLLYKNTDEFELRSEDFIAIGNLCEDMFTATIFRSIQGKEINAIFGSWKREESEQPNKSSSTWFPNIPTMGNRNPGGSDA